MTDFQPSLRPKIDHLVRTGGVPAPELAAFALWEGSRSLSKEIRDRLGEEFQICAEMDVFWSERYYHQNIRRLYQRQNSDLQLRDDDGRKLSGKIGKPPFRLIIVRDISPQYTFKQSVSGIIEPTNVKIHELKYELRKLFSKPYQVHSTNNMSEFVLQIGLILGPDKLRDLLSGKTLEDRAVYRDLSGAGGWSNVEDMFDVLNFASDYAVLRSFSALPKSIEGGDIDIVCTDYQRAASALNLSQKEGRPYKGSVLVNGELVSIDLRFPGDGYYDALWAQKIIDNRIFTGTFYRPSVSDYFFSLFYHAKVHKPSVKDEYQLELARLASELDFDWFKLKTLTSDEEAAFALRGYMIAHGFCQHNCIDPGVHVHHPVASRLPSSLLLASAKPTLSQRFRKMRKKIKGKIKKLVKR